jgi:hypothetical protein
MVLDAMLSLDAVKQCGAACAELGSRGFEARAMQHEGGMKRSLAVAALAATLALTAPASAQHPRVAALHEGVQNLETRGAALRQRAARASETARRATERAVAVVDRQRVSIVNRLEVLELLGQSDNADARPVREMEETLVAAYRLLGEVESWYGIR